jgi:hypothetical protein
LEFSLKELLRFTWVLFCVLGLARPDEEDEEDVEYLPEDDDDAKKVSTIFPPKFFL